MKVVLETERLRLREFVAEDAELLCALDSDPEVMRYINGGQPTSLATIRDQTLPAFLDYYQRFAHYGFWAAFEKATDEFIGWFHFRPDRDHPDDIDLGYRLARRFWGRGLATEMACALVIQGFGVWGVERVVGYALEANKASRRVLEKAGLQLERSFVYSAERLPDFSLEQRQAVQYALARRDFRKKT